jgi:hypothetical protein
MTPVDGVVRGRLILILRIKAARTPRKLYWIRGAGQKTYFAEIRKPSGRGSGPSILAGLLHERFHRRP